MAASSRSVSPDAAGPGAFISPFLLISLNSDGVTLSRPPDALLPPCSVAPVASEDIPLDAAAGTWVRLYRPRGQNQQPALPLVVFFHGGGFVLCSAASALYHSFCECLAWSVPAVVVSVDYRLAPEHRLPAAYDDAMTVLRWLSSQADAAGKQEELLKGVDYFRCFLMGGSSGANIVYHAGRRAAAELKDRGPLRVAGHVYIQPYFGAVERTPSELAMENDAILPLRASDTMWDLALPEGADRDHEFCNPAKAAIKTEAGAPLPKCLVRGSTGDPLIDRQKEFANLLRAEGVEVVARLDEDGHHAAELFDSVKAQRLFDDVGAFINAPAAAVSEN